MKQPEASNPIGLDEMAQLRKENERLRSAVIAKANDAQRKRAGAASCPHCLERVAIKGEFHDEVSEFHQLMKFGPKRPVGEVHGSPGETMRCPVCDQLFVHGEEFAH